MENNMVLECILNNLNFKQDYNNKTYCVLNDAKCPYRDLILTDIVEVERYSTNEQITFTERARCTFAEEQKEVYHSWKDYMNDIKNRG